MYIHNLVSEYFIPNPENKPQVNHKDGNKQNNYYKNLEWVTCSENHQHAFRIGLSKAKKGEDTWNHKLTEKQVRLIKHLQHIKPKMFRGDIAKIFSISINTVRLIQIGLRWEHVKI